MRAAGRGGFFFPSGSTVVTSAGSAGRAAGRPRVTSEAVRRGGCGARRVSGACAFRPLLSCSFAAGTA